ncbi:STT3 domain-containing protein, partial [Haloquadratum walsbyi]|uniref:STT3 domain-containing protein n=1 Tax=Haloquadratum walsbyi TaxID=293091 RepID=UPI0023F51D81
MPTDRSRILPVVGALALVVIFRLVAVGNVFQQGYVVLVGNDPYYYRHHLIDFVAANRSPLTLAEGVKQGEPLFIVTLQIITAIFGGSFVAAEQVLAWYPIGAAVICGICVYLLGTRLTDDRRVGLASIAILATLPAHASRTGLGFADHHTLDVLILALVLTAVAAYERTSPTSVSELQRLAPLVILAGVGIGAQTLAWNAGALLLTPLGVYGFIRALASIRQDIPVLYRLTPLTASAAIGGGIAVLAHEIFGWQSAMMIVPPAILATALFILAIVTEGFRRIGLDYRTSAVGIITSGLIITVTGFELIPRFNEEFTEQLSRLSSAPQENIFEAQSLLSNDFGFILAPLIFFGLAFFISGVVVAWGSRVGWERDRGDCLLICVYWIMLLLFSLLQVRFAIHLALPMSILTGVSLVWLISKVTEVTPPHIRTVGSRKQSVTERRATWRSRSVNVDDQSSIQDANSEQINRRQVITAGVTLFMLIGGLGAVIAPVQAGEIAYDDDTIRAIDQINDFVASENQTLSETYVFSLWGNNRMYNAHVNNNSEKFGYAQNNFISFLRSSDTEEWYDRMQSRVGFIIIPEISEFSELDSETMYARLHDRQG